MKDGSHDSLGDILFFQNWQKQRESSLNTLKHSCIDVVRANASRSHLTLRVIQLHPQRLVETNSAKLRGTIISQSIDPNNSSCRRYRYYMTFIFLYHIWNKLPNSVKMRSSINGNRFLHLSFSAFKDFFSKSNSCIIYEDIDRPELILTI